MGMSVVVEADEKGRIMLPIEMRRKFATKRYKVTVRGEAIELEPLVRVASLKGKYRLIIKSGWEELEEKAETMVSHGER